MAARSRSVIRWGRRARGSRPPRCTSSRAAAAGTRSRRCASASGRASRSRSSASYEAGRRRPGAAATGDEMSQKKFASHADVEEKQVTFEKLSEHAYAYTAEGDPNTGIVVGDDAVMVIDTQATPAMAQD